MNKFQIYISETKEFYYQNQILQNFDIHNNFIEFVKINKFIEHNRKNKEKYLCVNINSLTYKSKKWTLGIECLGKYYKGSD